MEHLVELGDAIDLGRGKIQELGDPLDRGPRQPAAEDGLSIVEGFEQDRAPARPVAGQQRVQLVKFIHAWHLGPGTKRRLAAGH